MIDLSKSSGHERYYAYQRYLELRHPMSIKMNYYQWIEHEDQKFKAVEKKWSKKNLEKWRKDND